jgi:hypothetical protein
VGDLRFRHRSAFDSARPVGPEVSAIASTTAESAAAPGGLGWRTLLVAALAAAGLSLLLLEPALRGPIVSDDVLVFAGVPEVNEPSAASVAVLVDPRGEPVQVTANWAPVHLLAHMLAVSAFGSPLEDPYPHHVLNAVVHGLNAVLLAALLASRGVPVAAALFGGLLFLVHPANVETAAWISQLKTLLAFAFGFGALLALERRPALATLLFAVALLAKPSASAVLAAAIVFEAQRRAGPPRRTAWLFAWGLLLVLYTLPELFAFRSTGEFRQQLPLGPRALQAVAIAGRYLVLALTGIGSSTFHQPLPPASALDPWLWLGLATLLGFAFVSLRALWRGHPAAGWLGLAAAAYLPVAQLFPFRYPMADRYLYFVLPGLIGAALVTLAPRLRGTLGVAAARGLRAAPLALGAAALVATAAFGAQFHRRAGIWSSPEGVEVDAAIHYPEGIAGQLALARRLITQGDLPGAVDAIERAHARGHTNPSAFLHDPSLQPLLSEPRYVELLQGMTERWLARARALPRTSASHWVGIAQAELFMGRADPAFEALDRAESLAEPEQREGIRRMRAELEQALANGSPATP